MIFLLCTLFFINDHKEGVIMKLIGIKKCLFLLLLVGFLGNGFLLGMERPGSIDTNSSAPRPDTQGLPLRECEEFVALLEEQRVVVGLGSTEVDAWIIINPSTFYRIEHILSGQLKNEGRVHCPLLILSDFNTIDHHCASLLSEVFTGVERLILRSPGHFRKSRVHLQLFFKNCPSIKEVTICDVKEGGLRLFTLRHCIPKKLDGLIFGNPSDLFHLRRNSHAKYTRLVRRLIELAPKRLLICEGALPQQHVEAIQAAGITVRCVTLEEE